MKREFLILRPMLAVMIVAYLESAAVTFVNAQQAPRITVEPLSQDVSAGSEVSFNVTAVGDEPFSYQWRKEGIDLVDGGKVSGATTARLTLSGVQGAEMGRYSARVSNELGSVISAEASLHLVPLAAWGYSDYGQATVPAGFSNIVAIAAGPSHNLVVRADGTVAAWGGNINAYGYTNVPPGLSNVVAVAAGSSHSLALRSDGTVVAWGYDYYGQASPPSDLTNAVSLAAGSGHSLALRSDGSVVAWGNDHFGQATVPGGLSNAMKI